MNIAVEALSKGTWSFVNESVNEKRSSGLGRAFKSSNFNVIDFRTLTNLTLVSRDVRCFVHECFEILKLTDVFSLDASRKVLAKLNVNTMGSFLELCKVCFDFISLIDSIHFYSTQLNSAFYNVDDLAFQTNTFEHVNKFDIVGDWSLSTEPVDSLDEADERLEYNLRVSIKASESKDAVKKLSIARCYPLNKCDPKNWTIVIKKGLENLFHIRLYTLESDECLSESMLKLKNIFITASDLNTQNLSELEKAPKQLPMSLEQELKTVSFTNLPEQPPVKLTEAERIEAERIARAKRMEAIYAKYSGVYSS